MIELEKKWLLSTVPSLEAHGMKLLKHEYFEQCYISPTDRIRAVRETGVPEYTEFQSFRKVYAGGGSSVEELSTITKDAYYELKRKCIRWLEKTRTTYLEDFSGLHYEVDYIRREWPAVSVAVLEVEFQNKWKDMDEVNANYNLPGYLDQYVFMDVTGNRKFSNYSLANERRWR